MMSSAAGTAPTPTKSINIIQRQSDLYDAVTAALGAVTNFSPDKKDFHSDSGNAYLLARTDGNGYTFGLYKEQGEKTYSWIADNSEKTPEQIAYGKARQQELEEQRELDEIARHQAAAVQAQNDLSTLLPARADDPYPTKKGCTPYGCKRNVYGATFAPIHDYDTGDIVNHQQVSADLKYVVGGAKFKGIWLPLGIDPTVHADLAEDSGKLVSTVPLPPETPLYVVEGVGAGWSLFEAVQSPIFITFGCSKIVDVCKQLRYMYPLNKIVIAADTGHAGFTSAIKAASAVKNCWFLTPIFKKLTGSNLDVNDLCKDEGLDAVKAQFGLEAVKAHISSAITLPAPAETAATYTDDWRADRDRRIAEFNRTHASVIVGTQHRFMRETEDGEYQFFKPQDLVGIHSSDRVQITETRKVNIVKAWDIDPSQRCYRGGIFFAPGRELKPDCFNTFKGYAVEPILNAQLIELTLDHILNVICSGNVVLFTYALKWMAYSFQYPGEPTGVAFVCRGEKGAGKSLLGYLLRCIYGRHAIQIAHPRHLVGNFNSLLNDKVFIVAEEAAFAGDKAAEQVLKAQITEPTITIERKGIDAVTQPNYLTVMMTTNSEWAVPCSRDERRFFVTDVSSHKIGDRAYFNALKKSIDDEATQSAFLYFMLQQDLAGFHPGDVPESEGLRSQRFLSMDSLQKWFAECLLDGGFDGDTWFNDMTTKELYSSYTLYCDKAKLSEFRRSSQCSMGLYLGKKLAFEKIRRVGNSGARGFYFGTLDIAISRFETYEKVSLEEME
jgi:phage/plasmid primase-like uncharacterized protein